MKALRFYYDLRHSPTAEHLVNGNRYYFGHLITYNFRSKLIEVQDLYLKILKTYSTLLDSLKKFADILILFRQSIQLY